MNNNEITPLTNTSVRKDQTVSICRCADTGQFLPLGTRRYTVIASCAVLSMFKMLGPDAVNAPKLGGLLMYQTDYPDGGFFHFLDFFGPGSTGQGLDAWSLYDLLGSDGSTISSNGFNWALEFSGALLGTDFTKSGIIRHFEIPVGSLVTAQGNAELSVNDLLTSVKSVQNVKDPGGTNFQMKNAIVNHNLCAHLNSDFGSWTTGTNYAWEQAIGYLSSEYVSGMIFEAPFTDPSSGSTNTFQLASAAHAVFAFNKI